MVLALGIALLIVFVAWTAGWFYMASRLESQMRQAIAQFSEGSGEASCAQMDVWGYPFQLGVSCEPVTFLTDDRQYAGKAKAFHSSVQLNDPNRIAGEVEAPLQLESSRFPPLSVGWDHMSLSTRYAEPLPETLSIDGRNVTFVLQENGSLLAEVGRLLVKTKVDQSDLDITLRLADMTSPMTGGEGLPPLSLEADVSLTDGVPILAQNGLASMRGLSGRLDQVHLRAGSGDAQLWISGDYEVDSDGLIDGDIKIKLQSPEEIGDLLAELVPAEADAIRGAFDALDNFAVNDGRTPSIPVKVENGVPSILFIKLPAIPPLP
ncbi:DUF2125 domain-containing protein [Notoacmeibacter ruber]|nr:DUF2125 domain-containing protein [Notoacmeibacter ruber]